MLAPVVEEVRAVLGPVVYGVDVSGLAECCFAHLLRRGLTLATAESCTGGLVAEQITALPGASKIYRGGVVSYWTSVKQGVLGSPGDPGMRMVPCRNPVPGRWRRARGGSPGPTLPCPLPA